MGASIFKRGGFKGMDDGKRRFKLGIWLHGDRGVERGRLVTSEEFNRESQWLQAVVLLMSSWR